MESWLILWALLISAIVGIGWAVFGFRAGQGADFRKPDKLKSKLASELDEVSRRLMLAIEGVRILDRQIDLFMSFGSAEDFLVAVRKDLEILKNMRYRKWPFRPPSPFIQWVDEWVIGTPLFKSWRKTETARLWWLNTGNKGWRVDDAFKFAVELQLKEWSALRKKRFAKAYELQVRERELSKRLGIKPEHNIDELLQDDSTENRYRVEITETRRDKLAKVRVEIAKLQEEERALEEEILEELPADLPHREAAGVPPKN